MVQSRVTGPAWGTVWRGFAAGAVGTAALAGVERMRDQRLGRVAVYAPERIARRLLARAPERSWRRAAATAGQLARWTYGPVLGALYATLRGRLPRSVPVRGAALGAAVCAGELAVLPAIGATPAVSRWPAGQVRWLVVQTAVFGVVTACAMAAIVRGRRRIALEK